MGVKPDMIDINETLELDPAKEYPFRASLTKVARCGMCMRFKVVDEELYGCICEEGFELKYPLLVNTHDCDFYHYNPHRIEQIPDDKILIFTGLMDRLDECNRCSHQFHGICDGLRWYPFERPLGICEFFRDKRLTCKHAVPCFQYGTTTRNNYCKLDPKDRDGDMKRGWTWMCPGAHSNYADRYKCYQSQVNCSNCEFAEWDDEFANVMVGCSKGNILDWAYKGFCNDYKEVQE